MAEQTFQETTGKQTGSRSKSGSDASQGIGDQAAAASRELKDKAAGLAESTGEKLKEGAAELSDAARQAASQAADKIKETVSEQKGAGAEYVGSLAEAMRRASREFDKDLPIAGKYIRKAASQVENVADSIRAGDINDLVDSAKSFARRQPVAFLGLATLAGFAAVRFLKSSPEGAQSSSYRSSTEHRPSYRASTDQGPQSGSGIPG
jgi:hypothetical protein